MFPKIPKPQNWDSLALYQKVRHYRSHLTPEHSRFVDKLEAKKIVKEILGDDIEVAKVIRVLDNPNDLKPADLNEQKNVFIKATHGSGWNIFIDNINNKINHIKKIEEYKKLLQSWNKVYNNGDGEEIQYRYIRPRFFIEEMVKDKILEKDVINYKFRCINGKVIPFITVTVGKMKNFYNFDWILLNKPEIPFNIPKPVHLNKLIYCAEKLSSPFEFVRMDFYISNEDKIYFSEYTFTPSNGVRVLSHDLEYTLGKSWTKD